MGPKYPMPLNQMQNVTRFKEWMIFFFTLIKTIENAKVFLKAHLANKYYILQNRNKHTN